MEKKVQDYLIREFKAVMHKGIYLLIDEKNTVKGGVTHLDLQTNTLHFHSAEENTKYCCDIIGQSDSLYDGVALFDIPWDNKQYTFKEMFAAMSAGISLGYDANFDINDKGMHIEKVLLTRFKKEYIVRIQMNHPHDEAIIDWNLNQFRLTPHLENDKIQIVDYKEI